jgi:hypothetical protein
MNRTTTCSLLATAALVAAPFVPEARTQTADALINKLVEKGILTDKEAKDLIQETTQTNLVSASKWKINDAIKNLQLFGDVRFRYEYRGADSSTDVAAGTADNNRTYYRERFRYAVRVGLRGDLYDDFYYGLRVETSANPRSPWVTFGDDTASSANSNFGTPGAKNSDSIGFGQVYLGWRPTDWSEVTVGKMGMPLYTTPMIWDSDINPEGAVEKFKFSLGDVDLFANFGQFIYQNTDPSVTIPSADTFLLAWQLGADLKITKDISLKAAPVLYTYTGVGHTNKNNAALGEYQVYTGQGYTNVNQNGLNVAGVNFNQSGINDLLVLEIPAELNFKVGKYGARVFGDFAYNLEGADRARAAFNATRINPGTVVTPGLAAASLARAYTDEVKAYQVGAGFGNLGLVYGQTSKKNTWEARAYWQHIEQYAVDVNLIDSDFFEGRANLEGVYAAFAYSFTDAIIATLRYGYAHRINQNLGTGGNNPDLPGLNPIDNYHLLQLDLTWRF